MESGNLLALIIGFFAMVIFLAFGSTLILVPVTLIYPVIKSIKVVEALRQPKAGTRKTNDDLEMEEEKWISYWFIIGLLTLLETLLWFIFKFIPGYALFKTAFAIYLMAPQTEGALTLTANFIYPLYREYQDEIKEVVNEVYAALASMIPEKATRIRK